MQYFVDYEAGSCTLDSDGFKELLWLATYENYVDASIDEAKIRADLTTVVSFDSVDNYELLLLSYEDYHLIGLPVVEGSGHYLSGTFPIGICSYGENQAGATAFVEYLLSEEYQSEAEGLPLRTEVLERQFSAAKEERELTQTSYASGEDALAAAAGSENANSITQTITLPAMTEAELDELRSLLSSVTCTVSPMQTELISLIEEEFEYYYTGQKELDEVADIMQGRAEIFVAERQ